MTGAVPTRRALGRRARRLGACALILAAALCSTAATAGGAPWRIVAVGASNTSGWLISETSAYPALLQDMLRVRGIDALVANAGVPFDTTSGMLARLDAAVPAGTDIAILQPGGNDLRFFGTREARAANVAEMTKRLRARSIAVIVYDEDIPWRYVFDGIHLTPAGHTMIATALLPQVMATVRAGRARRPRSQADRRSSRDVTLSSAPRLAEAGTP